MASSNTSAHSTRLHVQTAPIPAADTPSRLSLSTGVDSFTSRARLSTSPTGEAAVSNKTTAGSVSALQTTPLSAGRAYRAVSPSTPTGASAAFKTRISTTQSSTTLPYDGSRSSSAHSGTDSSSDAETLAMSGPDTVGEHLLTHEESYDSLSNLSTEFSFAKNRINNNNLRGRRMGSDIEQAILDAEGGDSSPRSSVMTRSTSIADSSVERTGLDSELFRQEAKRVASLSWPVGLGYLIQTMIPMMQIYSVGHLGDPTALSGTALAISMCSVTGIAVGIGLNSALDTLCSQAFTGSKDPHALGKHLQRGALVIAMVCIPIIAFWWNIEPLLLFIDQPAESSKTAQIVARYTTIGLFPILLNDCFKRYLQSQGIVKANLYVSIISAPIAFFFQWLFVFSPFFQMGFEGAALGTALTYCMFSALTFSYIVFIDGSQCWGGISIREMFNVPELTAYMKLALPGMFMTCTEWWALEALVFAAGMFGDTALSAQTILIQTVSLMYTIPFGISIGATTRVGNILGQGRPFTARATAIVSLLLAVIEGSTMFTLMFIIRRYWSDYWTDDSLVQGLVYETLPFLLIFHSFDALNAVSSGILRGCGKQNFGAAINLLGYYIIGIPLSFVLAKKYRLKGLWTGILVGVAIVAAIQIIVISMTDWIKEAGKARRKLDEAEAISEEIRRLDEEDRLEAEANARRANYIEEFNSYNHEDEESDDDNDTEDVDDDDELTNFDANEESEDTDATEWQALIRK